ncbi:MAG: thioredoxin family protein [Deltaproteobacteria bacterium]|nr:thioredoxin family protein [Deltaproteobacteria bacterium]
MKKEGFPKQKKISAGALITLLFCCFEIMMLCVPAAWAATASVTVLHSRDKYPAGGTYPLLFRVNISDHWYIHEAGKGGGDLIPTVLRVTPVRGVKITDIRFPVPQKKRFSFSTETISVYAGTFLVRATLRVDRKVPRGEKILEGRFSYQACSDTSCLPPETVPLSFHVAVAAQGTPTTPRNQVLFARVESQKKGQAVPHGFIPGAGLLLTLLGIFFGGMALNLTPCVYPLIPITVSYFGGRSGQKGGRPVFHGFLYMLGLAFTNATLGAVAALSGGLLGSALQSPIVLVLVAAILVGLATSFFGLWEIRVPSGLMQISARSFGGYFGTFFMGLTLGVVAAPCLGPFILGLLTFVGQKGDPALGVLYFFVLSMGLGFPLAVLAVFSSTLERLPLSGGWMVWIRTCFGWILMGMAAYMVLPLFPSSVLKSSVVGVVLVGAGLHLGWLEKSRSAWRGFVFVKRGVGVVLLTAAVIFFLAAPGKKPGIQWVAFDRTRLAAAVEQGKPILLDFSADWCSPCRAMERSVFSDPEVLALSKQFVTLRVDLTRRRPAQDKLLVRYGVRGVPTIIFIDRKGSERKILRVEDLIGKKEMIARMKEVLR